MKNISLIFIIILSGFLLSSCEQLVPFPETTEKPKLVLNGLFTSNDSIRIGLSQTIPINSDQIISIPDALVEISTNEGEQFMIPHLSDGNYLLSEIDIEPNKKFSVKASHPDFDDIEAKSSLPYDFAIDLIDSSYQNYEGIPAWEFDVLINVDIDDKQYFMVDVVYQYQDSSITPLFANQVEKIEFAHFSRDLAAENQSILADISDPTQGLKAIFIKEPDLESKQLSINFLTADRNLSKANAGEILATIRVRSISLDMYQYYISLERYRLALGDFFVEPVQIHSNIQGGVGIFGGFREQIIQLTL